MYTLLNFLASEAKVYILPLLNFLASEAKVYILLNSLASAAKFSVLLS